MDVVVTNGNGFSVALGNGDGTFQSAVFYATQVSYSLAVADFNNDGNLDIVLANQNLPGTVSVYLGNGDGTFKPPISSNTTQGCYFVAVGDFNGDKIPDIVIIDSPYISVLLGNGDGTFQAPSDNNSFVGARSLAVGDFNNDGKLDVGVVGSFGASSSAGVLLGNGDGTLQPSITSLLNSLGPESIAVGDFNHDGNLDVAAATQVGPAIVLFGKGDGSFQPEVDYPVNAYYGQVTVADFNGDGNLDLVVTTATPEGIEELLGNGDGTFKPAHFYQSGLSSGLPVVGDFNGDGKLDLVLAAGAGCTMTITFTPHKTGGRSGTAYVDVGQGANPPFVPLSGTGTN